MQNADKIMSNMQPDKFSNSFLTPFQTFNYYLVGFFGLILLLTIISFFLPNIGNFIIFSNIIFKIIFIVCIAFSIFALLFWNLPITSLCCFTFFSIYICLGFIFSSEESLFNFIDLVMTCCSLSIMMLFVFCIILNKISNSTSKTVQFTSIDPKIFTEIIDGKNKEINKLKNNLDSGLNKKNLDISKKYDVYKEYQSINTLYDNLQINAEKIWGNNSIIDQMLNRNDLYTKFLNEKSSNIEISQSLYNINNLTDFVNYFYTNNYKIENLYFWINQINLDNVYNLFLLQNTELSINLMSNLITLSYNNINLFTQIFPKISKLFLNVIQPLPNNTLDNGFFFDKNIFFSISSNNNFPKKLNLFVNMTVSDFKKQMNISSIINTQTIGNSLFSVQKIPNPDLRSINSNNSFSLYNENIFKSGYFNTPDQDSKAGVFYESLDGNTGSRTSFGAFILNGLLYFIVFQNVLISCYCVNTNMLYVFGQNNSYFNLNNYILSSQYSRPYLIAYNTISNQTSIFVRNRILSQNFKNMNNSTSVTLNYENNNENNLFNFKQFVMPVDFTDINNIQINFFIQTGPNTNDRIIFKHYFKPREDLNLTYDSYNRILFDIIFLKNNYLLKFRLSNNINTLLLKLGVNSDFINLEFVPMV